MTEIIVEFPSPFTEREKKMIFGYKGELIRCKYCQSWKENECNLPEFGWCGCLQQLTHKGDYCAWSPNLDEEKDEYVTLHREDIHFIDEDAERQFYESLAERKEE